MTEGGVAAELTAMERMMVALGHVPKSAFSVVIVGGRFTRPFLQPMGNGLTRPLESH